MPVQPVFWLLSLAGISCCAALSGSLPLLGLALLCLLLPLISAPIHWFLRKRISSEFSAPVNLEQGATGEVTLLLKNSTFLPLFHLRCRVSVSNDLLGTSQSFPIRSTLLPRRTVSLSLPLTAAWCGRLTLTADRLRLYDGFGLLPIPAPSVSLCHITVLPKLFESHLTLRPLAELSRDSEAYASDRPGWDLSEPFQVREYRPGDRPAQLHWKLSSKLDRLMVREASLPLERSVVLLWERTAPSCSPDRTDAMARAAVSLCRALLEKRVPVCMVWNDTQEQRCISCPLNSTDDLIALLPRLLSACGAVSGPTAAQLYPGAFASLPFSRLIYLTAGPSGAARALEQLGAVTVLTCGEDGEGTLFDPEHIEQQLAHLEL